MKRLWRKPLRDKTIPLTANSFKNTANTLVHGKKKSGYKSVNTEIPFTDSKEAKIDKLIEEITRSNQLKDETVCLIEDSPFALLKVRTSSTHVVLNID